MNMFPIRLEKFDPRKSPVQILTPHLIPKLLILMVFLAFGKSVASFFHDINNLQNSQTVTEAVTPPATTLPGLPDINQLAKAGWFGAAPGDKNMAGNPINSQLLAGFELKGISASLDNSFAGAFILQKDKSMETYYRIGDMLPGIGVIMQIYADHVIIEHGQSPLTLTFATTPTTEVR